MTIILLLFITSFKTAIFLLYFSLLINSNNQEFLKKYDIYKILKKIKIARDYFIIL